jgi:DNA-binding NarL/FixJ family response regulator
MGAEAEAATIAATLRRVPRRAPRPSVGFGALTGTERRVVDLIAEGLTNVAIAQRLFVSRRTVESHVSAAYRKLGVSTRVELARLVLDHERAPADPPRKGPAAAHRRGSGAFSPT